MHRRALIIALVAGAGAAATAAPDSGSPAAQNAAQNAALSAAQVWLALVDAGDYAASWQQTGSIFQGVVTADRWAQTIGPVRGPLGALRQRQLKSAEMARSLPGAPDGEYAVLQFNSSFAHKAAAVETVTLSHEAGGAWRVVGYFIK